MPCTTENTNPPCWNTPGDLDKICMQIINGHLRKHLWDSYCDELVVNDVDELIFVPVENSK